MRRMTVLSFLVPALLMGGGILYAQETPPATPPASEPAPAATAPPAPAGPLVKEVKIIIDNKAKSDGEIRLSFTPAGGSAKEIRVTVAKGMSKGDICRDIAKELTVALGANYKVDQYDVDKVKIEEKSGATFSLTLAGQTVGGISIELK